MNNPACILLIDDNIMDIELAENAFRQIGAAARLETLHSGREALDYLFGRGRYRDRGSHPLPDLILLDLKMPGIDGFEVLARIKHAPRLKRIPVVVLSSSHETCDRALSYDVGANSYLVKPLSLEGFEDLVQKVSMYWLALNAEPPVGAGEERLQ